ncbi:MAG: squalene synthase HpnD [Nitrospirae bacterium RIFCSPLOWO2_02_FULL_62_14]|nr:MAG: squalene synthase HpnD [Nitrospirae bacterium RIFCSPLOWO2_02_FULL_62_14]
MTPSEAQAYCNAVTKHSGSNFYYSFFFLPAARRAAMYTVYAFCKEVDSAVDDAPAGSDPKEAISRWRAEVAAVYGGIPTHPVAISLAGHVRQLGIPREYFDELINGVEMDLATMHYATFEDLSRYCYRVACVVGLICLHIFGTRDPRAKDYAVNLGMAFQLTNILRDLGTDADRGRIYLPLNDLTRFGYTEELLLQRRYSPRFNDLMAFQCTRAHEFYDKAHTILESLPRADRNALTPAEIMRGVYERILVRIEQAGYRVFDSRISLPPVSRLAVAAGVWLRNRLA